MSLLHKGRIGGEENQQKSNRKETLWSSFGDVLVENLNNNIDETVGKDIVLCERCGDRVEKTNNKKRVCKECARKENIRKTIERRKNRKCLK